MLVNMYLHNSIKNYDDSGGVGARNSKGEFGLPRKIANDTISAISPVVADADGIANSDGDEAGKIKTISIEKPKHQNSMSNKETLTPTATVTVIAARTSSQNCNNTKLTEIVIKGERHSVQIGYDESTSRTGTTRVSRLKKIQDVMVGNMGSSPPPLDGENHLLRMKPSYSL